MYTPSTTEYQLIDGARKSLQRLHQTISELDDTIYTRQSVALPGSTIGKHVRHIIEHYLLLINAITSGKQPISVNYASRRRDVTIETSVQNGMDAILSVADPQLTVCLDLLNKPDLSLRTPVRVTDTLPSGMESALMSTLGRELWFCTHHMVHHNAIIASLLHEAGRQAPQEFAYAPSTVKHNHSQGQP
ncbi:hypothetical protein H4R99_007625 [Coemansia sp. RSA 1722]|nr:hypothetical protein LPJ57_002161 [Coemansia sp. RSA 486]KAJ2588956.1 hypothetical protein H4R99_007625 [Coemansia sp. RSA 1722]KAJ2600832.1 hypothetical protein GGF39_001596 [Coemansia sp. RSA 1721]KAJ2634574.1 hypothetical protein GGF40_004118 [Coemansia sp. RSA 1286]